MANTECNHDHAPLTQVELDKIKCSDPTCKVIDHPIVLAPRCHPGRGQRVAYSAKDGVLQISCAECDKPICEVAVAANAATVH